MEEEQKPLELRMYFFVPYNISPIQQAIQAGHAAVRYGRKFGESELFKEFADSHETFVILNGGTTNDQRDFDGVAEGTLNQIADQLVENDILFTYFREPDLNNALTALCIICDERVFNRKDYQDFVDYIINVQATSAENFVTLKMQTNEKLQEMFPEYYKEWVRFLGGLKNVFLRELIRDKKLA